MGDRAETPAVWSHISVLYRTNSSRVFVCMHTYVWVHVNVWVPSPEVSVSVSLITLYFKIYVCVCTSMHACTMVHIWGPVDTLWESVFSFCHLGSRDQTQAVRLENRLSSAEPFC